MTQPILLDASTRVLVSFTVVAALATVVAALAAITYTYLTCQMRGFMKQQTRLVEVQTLHAIFDMMEATRAARTAVRSYLTACDSATPRKPYLPIKDDNVKQSVDDVCRIYDLLGVIDRHNPLVRNYIDELYSVPLVFLYEQILRGYVEDLRQGPRGLTHFWELTQFYERVKCTPGNHPANTPGATKWTKHRECPD